MLLMVIEHFRDNDMIPVYERVRDKGRMLPQGLKQGPLIGIRLQRHLAAVSIARPFT